MEAEGEEVERRWMDLNRILMLNVYNCYFAFLHAKTGFGWRAETLSEKDWIPTTCLFSFSAGGLPKFEERVACRCLWIALLQTLRFGLQVAFGASIVCCRARKVLHRVRGVVIP